MTATLFPTKRPASDRSIAFMQVLREKAGLDADLTPAEWIALGEDGLTQVYVSRAIDVLKAHLEANPPAKRERATVQVDEGVYEYEGEIYKVKHAVHGSGRLYAQKLCTEGTGKDADVWYEIARGIVTKLRPEHKLTRERAEAFGALYGHCIRCARPLTDEDSISRMMGRVCASKLGW